MTDIKVPPFPESVEKGTLLKWRKQVGDSFTRDDILVEIETDKIVLDVPATSHGVLKKINIKEGTSVTASQILGVYEETKGSDAHKSAPEKSAVKSNGEKPAQPQETLASLAGSVKSGPAARKLAKESGVDISTLTSSGKTLTKQDVAAAITGISTGSKRKQERIPMSSLRVRVAERLVQSQQTAAMLTTFNEVNMAPLMSLRAAHKKEFEEKFDARLGFMSFFVKASIYALHKFPEVNAYIEGEDMVYHNYNDIGIAVSSPRGLVVPVLRDVQAMDMAMIETTIADFGARAKNAKLTLEELQGGTFTISNGGVFGSLLSTPIINPPQTAILGMHKTQERPMAVNGEVQILPMMYLALSYDHRMIDGKTAVQFLSTVKEFIEYPGLNLLGL